MATVTKQQGGGGGKNTPAKKSEPNIFVKAVQYVKESWAETKRATWPSWLQIRQLTIAVILCIAFVTIYLYAWDRLLAWATSGLFKK